MCWDRRDLDDVRSKLREDFGTTRERGRVPRALRFAAWAAVGVLFLAMDLPAVAVPAVVLFEAFVAPRLARAPKAELGPLRRWTPPPGLDSPEALPTSWAGRDLRR